MRGRQNAMARCGALRYLGCYEKRSSGPNPHHRDDHRIRARHLPARKLGGLAFLVEGTVESLAPKMRFDKPETVPSVLRAFHRALVRKAPFSITLECEADDGQLGAWQVRVTL